MKHATRILAMAGLIFMVASCSELVKKTIQSNPDIVFEAIKKEPAKFMEVVREAAQQAQKDEMEKAQQEEIQAREDEFKNPKQPEISTSRAFTGAAEAPVTIVEYSDFQCPFCRRGSSTVNEVIKAYPGKVRLIYKHLPLESKHPNARRGSEFFEAIALQDGQKAYAFKEQVFENQNETYGDAEALYKKLAQKVGADMTRLMNDLNAKKDQISQIINTDMKEAEKFDISGTPGYLINGVTLKGAYPIDDFKKIIDRHLSKK